MKNGDHSPLEGRRGHRYGQIHARRHLPMNALGERLCLDVVETNAEDSVTWLHSYVSTDRRSSFCIYEAPSPEAIRRTARRNHLPVDSITEVRVLDPYFYR